MINLNVYKTNIGWIYSFAQSAWLDSSKILINDKAPVLFNPSNTRWFISDKEITSVKRIKPGKNEQIGWKLKSIENTSLIQNLPEKLSMEELSCHYDVDYGETEFVGEYSEVASLYEAEFQTLPEYNEETEFNLFVIRELEIQDYQKPSDMKIKFQNDRISFNPAVDQVEQLLSSVTVWDELEVLLTPEFLLHTRPCKLTSHQMFKIVRAWIKNNPSKNFKITSDYDFCFEAKKLVKVKPWISKVEKKKPNSKSYSPPRFESKEISSKEVSIFRMSYFGYKDLGGYGDYPCIAELKADNLQDHPCIAELKADNLQDLAENLKAYLDEIKVVLHAEVHECYNCSGSGHMVTEATVYKGENNV